MPTRRRTPPRRLAETLAATLLLAACTQTAPTAAPTATVAPPPTASPTSSQSPPAEVYSAIRKAVEAIRGLQPTADVDPVTIDAAQLRANLTAEFDANNTAADLKFSEEVLVTLGLLPVGSSLRELTLDFQGDAVAGYYSPDKNQLFVVSRSGGLGPSEEVTYSHEFTHQLQDQHFDLGKLGIDATNESDRALAQLALIEGDAVSVQNRWTTANLTAEEMGQLLSSSLDPQALQALQRAPAYLRETSLFPYLTGNPFVEALIARGGYQAVNDAFGHPPVSTEQVLHPEKYAKREAPDSVKVPADIPKSMGAGWSEVGQDTLGEFVLRLWLSQNSVPPATAAAAAAGWGGDRVVLVRGPSGLLTVGVVTMWDTEADATEFAEAAQPVLERLGTAQTEALVSGGEEVVLAIGPGSKQLTSVLEVGIPSRQ